MNEADDLAESAGAPMLLATSPSLAPPASAMYASSFSPSPPITGAVQPAAVAAVRNLAPTWYSPPKKTTSGLAPATGARALVKSIVPSGTTTRLTIVPPFLENVVANLSARPLLTGFVSL